MSLLIAQTLCWSVFLHVLFYYVPAYTKLHQDFSETPTQSWQILVAISDWVVVNTLMEFPFFAVCLLIAFLVLLNAVIGRPGHNTESGVLWFIAAFVFTFALLISDNVFPVCLLMFLASLVLVNIVVGRPDYNSLAWMLWSISTFILPLSLLVFEAMTISVSVKRIVSRHPEILEYGLWWVNIVA